jgi:hypothetical protein
MTKVLRVYLAALVWGFVSIGLAWISIHQDHGTVSAVWQIIFDVITAAIIFMGGRAAKQENAKPVGVGVLTGLIFSVISGWSAFLVHVSRSTLMRSLHGKHLSTSEMNTALHFANSTAVHVGSWIGIIVVSTILGLIFGAVGGAVTKRPSRVLDV